MISLPAGYRIWLVAGITDMRNNFNSLAFRAQHVLKDDPFSGHLFILFVCAGGMARLLTMARKEYLIIPAEFFVEKPHLI
ncbi:transposase [Salmonella enterica subsp. enterica serovar Enteritidis]|nr:transposase [Salmonella enterica subsp. enterica serovar Newport]EBS5765057.1 hypothetical protein [Salmonella enterica subsp. enterica serovar Enteritidis]ECG6590308.1 hypothetical protein [Salmonella enterica subsp. enterica serovar Newport]EGU1063040.1 transposase [Salmonella enterica subsp. enterica serovar Enteritidis]EHF2785289.1 transposase [Salmonella enterica subsp. enterica serovar Enteritidis]